MDQCTYTCCQLYAHPAAILRSGGRGLWFIETTCLVVDIHVRTMTVWLLKPALYMLPILHIKGASHMLNCDHNITIEGWNSSQTMEDETEVSGLKQAGRWRNKQEI